MKVLAVCVADIHLSMKKPRCRWEEQDWMAVQARQLGEVCELAAQYDCPVLCSGDIFDSWNVSPELIHFALRYLPDGMFAVAGNHDLPYHSIAEVDRSAYGVLVAAKKVQDVRDDDFVIQSNGAILDLYGRAWGDEINKPQKATRPRKHVYRVLIAHKYVWTPQAGHPGAGEGDMYKTWEPIFDWYDAVLLGDNHKHWHKGNCFNPGSFYIRTVIDTPPVIGLLVEKADGSGVYFKEHQLRSAGADQVDSTVAEPSVARVFTEVDEFVKSLRNSVDNVFDFKAAVYQYIRDNKPDKRVSEVLLQALGE
jgi:hypothetical protein